MNECSHTHKEEQQVIYSSKWISFFTSYDELSMIIIGYGSSWADRAMLSSDSSTYAEKHDWQYVKL